MNFPESSGKKAIGRHVGPRFKADGSTDQVENAVISRSQRGIRGFVPLRHWLYLCFIDSKSSFKPALLANSRPFAGSDFSQTSRGIFFGDYRQNSRGGTSFRM